MDDDPVSKDVMSVYRLLDEKTGRLLTDRVTFIFLELPKFKKSLDELDGNILEGMCFCFKNMGLLNERPKVLNHQVFSKIFEVSEMYNMDKDIRDKVNKKMNFSSCSCNQRTSVLLLGEMTTW